MTQFLLGFLLMTAYIPIIIGAAIPTGWVVLWMAVPLMIWKPEIPVLFNGWGMAFLVYAAMSWMWAPHGTLMLMKLLALGCVVVWASQQTSYRLLLIGLAAGLAVSDLIALVGGFHVYAFTGRAAGLFVNSNVFAETAGMLLVLLLLERLWWLVPVTVPGLMESSRSVMIGLVVASAVWGWPRIRTVALRNRWPAIGTIIGLFTIAGFWLNSLLQRDGGSSLAQRWAMWQDTLSGLVPWGHGIGSFQFLYPLYANHIDTLIERPVNAHNDLFQLTFELGIGVIPLLVVVYKLSRVNDDYRCALVFFLVIGSFGFPLFMPVSAFMAAIVAGRLAARGVELRSAGVLRRPALSGRLRTA